MKKLSLTLVMAVAVIGSAFAGTDAKTFKDKVVVEPTCKFRDTEFQIDGFYSGFVGSRNSQLRTGSGGGIGFNYFFAKYFGIGYEATFFSSGGNFEALPLNGNFFVRYPICSLNLAPYIMVGGGAGFGDKTVGFGNVGAGLEYRITDHIGLFSDGRYYYGGSGNVANIRGGLRFAF